MGVVVVVGAGATLSDAGRKAIRDRPPLDRGFFRGSKTAGLRELDLVRTYMLDHYAVDPTSPENDSLETVMGVVYCDIYNPAGPQKAFRFGLVIVTYIGIPDTTGDFQLAEPPPLVGYQRPQR